MSDERVARIQDVADQLERVLQLHKKLLRAKHVVTETDGMTVRRLIRLLVEEWV